METLKAEIKIAEHSLEVYKEAYNREHTEMLARLTLFWENVIKKQKAELARMENKQ